MADIVVKEGAPGLEAANYVQAKIDALGVQDIKIMFDKEIRMWAICQVEKRTNQILLPEYYTQDDIRPMIMWWCKDNQGRFRAPNDNDVNDVIVTVTKAHKIWDKGGDWLDDQFKAKDLEREIAHQRKFKKRIKEIAPEMKRAIRKDIREGRIG